MCLQWSLFVIASQQSTCVGVNCTCKLASCQTKFVVHEIMNCVASLKVHLRDCTDNVNIRWCMFFYRRDRANLNYSISILLVWRKMLTSFMYRLIWAGLSEFGSYHLCEQRRFGRSCASPESQQLAQTSNESRGTFRQKARSLPPLNDWAWAVKIFHDQECSKTQIRLTRPIFLR